MAGHSYLLVNDWDEHMEAYDHSGRILCKVPFPRRWGLRPAGVGGAGCRADLPRHAGAALAGNYRLRGCL
jgi:hypothetical protein